MPDTTTRLPKAVLGYLDVVTEGRLVQPGTVAHRRRGTYIGEEYKAIGIDGRPMQARRQVDTPACLPPPSADPGPIYLRVSAWFANAHGAVACPECFPEAGDDR